MNSEEHVKEMILKLVREHKISCCGKPCGISFSLIRFELEKKGFKFTKEERKEMI